jgi:FlaA1/EpsC-like NDP-sugar epimerase
MRYPGAHVDVVGVTHRLRRVLLPFRGRVLLAADLGAWLLGFVATARLSLGPNGAGFTFGGLVWSIVVLVAVQATIGQALGLYRGRYRVGTYDEAVAVATTWAAVTLATSLVEFALSGGSWLAETPALFRSSIALAGMGISRLSWRRLVERTLRPGGAGLKRVIVYGAGEAGYLLIRGMMTDPTSKYVPIALLDDDPTKAERTLMGIRVAGTVDDLAQVARQQQADLVIIAIPSATSPLIGRVVDEASSLDVEVRTLPSPSELAGPASLRDVRRINEDDLLGRTEVKVDIEQITGFVRGKRVLVTGAGGSIGSELCKQLERLDPAELIMLDRDESGLHGTQLAIEQRALLDSPSLVVADIRDRERIFRVFEHWRPEVVFHAAALKHLSLLEQHPMEAVKTNVMGTRNIVDAAVAVGSGCVVNVSTDKAANPTSVLGLTKLMAEQYAAEVATVSRSRVVSVRFGNVLGSRGSVLPTFLRQIANGGPVTVTHPDVTRYFMTIPEAVRLVLQAGAIGDSGEIMILDMGEPVRIVDLAQRLIAHHDPTVDIEFTGLRPGEKLHEVLVADHEVGVRRVHPRIFHTESIPSIDLDRVLDDLLSMDEIEAKDLAGIAMRKQRGSAA